MFCRVTLKCCNPVDFEFFQTCDILYEKCSQCGVRELGPIFWTKRVGPVPPHYFVNKLIFSFTVRNWHRGALKSFTVRNWHRGAYPTNKIWIKNSFIYQKCSSSQDSERFTLKVSRQRGIIGGITSGFWFFSEWENLLLFMIELSLNLMSLSITFCKIQMQEKFSNGRGRDF